MNFASMDAQTIMYGLDGGHRICKPEATLDTLERLLSGGKPILGCWDISPAQSPVHIYQTHFVRAPAQIRKNGPDRYNLSLGKGQSGSQARVSALAEAVERMGAYFRGDEPLRNTRLKDLGDAGIHPNECLLFSEDQYRNRKETNRSLIHTSVRVPEPFPGDLVVPWVPLWSMIDEVEKYLPAACCYYAFPDPSAGYCRMDYNGHAAGNSLEEAILQGFLELIERDSVALWWYNRVQMPSVDLESFDVSYIPRLKAYYRSIHRTFWVLDVTSDFGIPAFVAVSTSTLPAPANEPILYGTGAHFDARIALLRALTEMSQALPAILAARQSAAIKLEQLQQAARMDYWPSSNVAIETYLKPSSVAASKKIQDFPTVPYDDIPGAMLYIKKLLSEKKLDILCLDQTRQDLGLHVVKVVVPGLRPYWLRLAPGRLYEIPVQLGWLSESKYETEMNSAPITR